MMIQKITSGYLNYPITKKIIRLLEEDYSVDPDEYSAILKTVDRYMNSIASSKKELPVAKKMIKSNPEFFNNSLTPSQKQLIRNMVREDFEEGRLYNNMDDLVDVIVEDGSFDGVEDLAVDYYLNLASKSSESFYENDYGIASSKKEVKSSKNVSEEGGWDASISDEDDEVVAECQQKAKPLASKKSIDQNKVNETVNLIQQNYPSYKNGSASQIASDFGLTDDEAECVITALNPIQVQEETEPEETLEVVNPRKVIEQAREVGEENHRSGGLF